MFCPFCGAALDFLASGEGRCRSVGALLSAHIVRELSDAFIARTRNPSPESLGFAIAGRWFRPGCGILMHVTANDAVCRAAIGI
jgi:hypothetical protein